MKFRLWLESLDWQPLSGTPSPGLKSIMWRQLGDGSYAVRIERENNPIPFVHTNKDFSRLVKLVKDRYQQPNTQF